MPVDHKAAYSKLRNYLAGQHLGSTRDEALLHEALKAMICLSYIESGRGGGGSITEQYRKTWIQVRSDVAGLFSPTEELELSDEIIPQVHGIIQGLDLHSGDYDPFGDLYEAFIGDAVKGLAGQFFTPQNAVKLLIEMVAPRPDEKVMDPACGAGGFLAAVALKHLSDGVDPARVAQTVVGSDKDEYLSKLAKARLAVLTSTKSDVYCADSLAWKGSDLPSREEFGQVDVILTNPPFGSKIVAASKAVQADFDLGHQWLRNRTTGEWTQKDKLQLNPAPQVLFMERCLDLLKPGGRLGMVVPESLVSSSSHGYVVDFLRKRANILAVVGMPESLFKTSGSGGTHTKTCLLVAQKHSTETPAAAPDVFMAEAKWCGNDSRGRQIFPDELPVIADRWKAPCDASLPEDHLSYIVKDADIIDGVLAPRYYNPDVMKQLETLEPTHELISVGELVKSGVLEIRTGDEVGKAAYSTGDIPFVRTSDISNWEIKLDPKHLIAEEVYDRLSRKQDVREGDIFMVRDGTYLIGTCAYVTKYDTRIVYQSHILKIRVLDKDRLSPHLLLAALTSAPVKKQIASKRFTQDIIDTLGNRLHEVVLALPKDVKRRERIAETVKRSIDDRMEARELARVAVVDIVGPELAEDASPMLTV